MKKAGLILLLAVISYCVISQDNDTLNIAPDVNEDLKDTDEMTITDENEDVQETQTKDEVSTVILNEEEDKVSIGTDEFILVEEKGDTTNIKIGDKGISIVEDDKGTSVKILDNEEKQKKRKKFKGHWAGAEFGFNNFLDEDFSMTRTEDEKFMDLNTGRSWNFNCNFLQYSLGLIKDRFGLVTGLGFEFNNYHFDGDNNIAKDTLGNIVSKEDYPTSLNKSKLTTTFLTVPLLMEVQLLNAKRSKRIHFTGGLITGVKLGSHTKVVYKVDGKKEKDKSKDDFNINPLRYGVTARIGYRQLNLYGNYYLTPFYEKGGNPELYPFTVGLSFLF
jgi:hypothetical protein